MTSTRSNEDRDPRLTFIVLEGDDRAHISEGDYEKERRWTWLLCGIVPETRRVVYYRKTQGGIEIGIKVARQANEVPMRIPHSNSLCDWCFHRAKSIIERTRG
jgi:hypothetical protein